jgi:hypothetical protein
MIDPFTLLGVDPEADDDAIRAAFHARVRAGTADAAVNHAYAEIRDAGLRRRRRWTEPTAMLALPPPASAPAIETAAVAAELAFLSDWELGDDHAG